VKCCSLNLMRENVCRVWARSMHQHAHFHDELTLAKSDTSTGYASYYNVYGALKCGDCRLEWKNYQPDGEKDVTDESGSDGSRCSTR